MELILPKAADVKLTFGFPKTTPIQRILHLNSELVREALADLGLFE